MMALYEESAKMNPQERIRMHDAWRAALIGPCAALRGLFDGLHANKNMNNEVHQSHR